MPALFFVNQQAFSLMEIKFLAKQFSLESNRVQENIADGARRPVLVGVRCGK